MYQTKTFKILSLGIIIVLWLGLLGWFLIIYGQNQAQNQIKETAAVSQIDNVASQKSFETSQPESNAPDLVKIVDQFPAPQNPQEKTPAPVEEAKPTSPAKTQSLDQPKATTPSKNSSLPIRLPTNETVPTSDKIGNSNTLVFSTVGIEAPILYARLEDIFEKNPDGSINATRPIQEDLKQGPLSTPVQRLLTRGIVHLPFTPNPGEFGNSYIVGHSSNYASVKSAYNYIFKDLGNAKVGDEFTIFNSLGKGLIFKVFEKLEVNSADVDKAYQDFGSRRVVTLQASILVNGKPLKRLLVRGELSN